MDPAAERKLGVDLFNHVWTLLELPERTVDQIDEMVHAAHASAHHWRAVGEPVNLARSHWQCSRVYTVLDRAEPALWHAQRCLDLCEQHGIGDWDLAYAYEALARGHAVAGNAAESARFTQLAEEAGTRIAEAEDRDHFREDLATLAGAG